jgi:hypothetical protein
MGVEKLYNSSLSWFAALLAGSIWFGFSNPGGVDGIRLHSVLVLLILFPILGMILFFVLQYYNLFMVQLGQYILWLELKYSLMLPQTDYETLQRTSATFGKNYVTYRDEDLVARALATPLGWESLSRIRWDKQINAYLFSQIKNRRFFLAIVAIACLPGSMYLLDKWGYWGIVAAIGYSLILIRFGNKWHPRLLQLIDSHLPRPLDSPFVNPWAEEPTNE